MSVTLTRAELEAIGGHDSLATLMKHPNPLSPRSTPIDTNLFDTPYARAILWGLQRKNVYQGTVDPAEVQRRRVKNRAARKARKITRHNA